MSDQQKRKKKQTKETARKRDPEAAKAKSSESEEASEPEASEPVAAEPVAAEPVAAEPVAAEPVASEPVEASDSPEPTDAAEDAEPNDGAKSKDEAKPKWEAKAKWKAQETKTKAKTKPPAPKRDPRAMALRIVRGGLLFVAGLTTTFLLMANDEQIHRGPLYGMLSMGVAIVGLLDLLGLFSDRDKNRISLRDTALFPLEGEPLWLSPLVTVPLSILVLAIGVGIGGYDGLTVTILLALVPLVGCALRREPLMLFVVVTALYLPFLGVYGLWDPWETHYGEVAREMLARDDWVSLWWAQEDWFWSKPILIFWTEALSMGAYGVDFMPDGNPDHPEWAIRTPHFLLALGTLMAVYRLVSTVWTKRAGLVTGIVLATVPHFFLIAHQAITDMPFVANMTIAICMLALAIREKPTREVKTFGLGPITLSGRHVVIAAISIVILPQILYLASRNVTFMGGFPPFGWHEDIFQSGSGHNVGVPGNATGRNVQAYMSGPAAQPIAQAGFWLLGYIGLLITVAREKRAQSLYMFVFYLFCALAFMSKGIPGFALPGLVALFFLLTTRRWNLLLGGRLRVAPGILIVILAGMPWYVAMYIRHGRPFLQRILIHDHVNRLTTGVHGDNGTIQYFIEQLGFGLFPWVGLIPLALAAWLTPWDDVVDRVRGRRDESGAVTPKWARVSLFVVAAAIPLGFAIWLGSWLGAGEDNTARWTALALSLAASVVLVGAGRSRRARVSNRTLATILASIGAGTLTFGLLTWVTFRESGAGWLALGLTLVGALLSGCAGLMWRDRNEAHGPWPTPEPADNSTRAKSDRKHTLLLIGLWAASAFTLFSAMTTKFHHYIFPAVVPAAILVGVALDKLLLPRDPSEGWRGWARTALAMMSPTLMILGVAGLWGDVRGVIPVGTEDPADWAFAHPWPTALCVTLIAVGITMFLVAFGLGYKRTERESKTHRWARGAMTTSLLAAPPVLALVGRDLSWVTDARPQGYERLIQLFVYNYGRPWPTELDYRPILTGFAIVATCVILLAAFRPLRDTAVRAFLGVAIIFTAWTLDFYIIDLSPHWGQRELIEEYYRLRESADEPIVAYQMNWKGENFYTGNRVNVFVQLDNRALRNWVAGHQGQTAYFLLERGRLGGLRGVLRGAEITEETDDRFCNKFILVSARIPPGNGEPITDDRE